MWNDELPDPDEEEVWQPDEDVTTIIGLRCVDGIVLGADSQRTGTSTKFVRKPRVFNFKNGVGIFGCAGRASFIKQVWEIVPDAIRSVKAQMPKQIADRILDSLRGVAMELGHSHAKKQPNVKIVLAVRCNNPLQFGLFHIDLREEELEQFDYYAVAGTGSGVAKHAILQFGRGHLPQMTRRQARRLAYYAVRAAKRADDRSGGPARIFSFGPDNEHAYELGSTIRSVYRHRAKDAETAWRTTLFGALK